MNRQEKHAATHMKCTVFSNVKFAAALASIMALTHPEPSSTAPGAMLRQSYKENRVSPRGCVAAYARAKKRTGLVES